MTSPVEWIHAVMMQADVDKMAALSRAIGAHLFADGTRKADVLLALSANLMAAAMDIDRADPKAVVAAVAALASDHIDRHRAEADASAWLNRVTGRA